MGRPRQPQSRRIWYSENAFGQKTNHNIDTWSELTTYKPIRYSLATTGPSGDVAVARVVGDFNCDGRADAVMYGHGDGVDRVVHLARHRWQWVRSVSPSATAGRTWP